MEGKRISKSFHLFVIISVLIIVVYSVCLTVFMALLARDNRALQTYATRLEKRLDSIEQIVKNRATSPSSSSKITRNPDASSEMERLSNKVNKIKCF
jgi:sensor c-di-GMP phosphodiesterase-like protein